MEEAGSSREFISGASYPSTFPGRQSCLNLSTTHPEIEFELLHRRLKLLSVESVLPIILFKNPLSSLSLFLRVSLFPLVSTSDLFLRVLRRITRCYFGISCALVFQEIRTAYAKNLQLLRAPTACKVLLICSHELFWFVTYRRLSSKQIIKRPSVTTNRYRAKVTTSAYTLLNTRDGCL